jgi:hypothetical protein
MADKDKLKLPVSKPSTFPSSFPSSTLPTTKTTPKTGAVQTVKGASTTSSANSAANLAATARYQAMAKATAAGKQVTSIPVSNKVVPGSGNKPDSGSKTVETAVNPFDLNNNGINDAFEGEQQRGGTEDAAAAELRAQALADRKSAFAIIEDAFSGYGLDSLIPTIKSLMEQGVGSEEASIELKKTDVYKQRFIGNEGRIAKGLAVYSPGEYLQAEQTYRDIMAASGLESLATKESFGKLIGGAVSPAEVQDRIQNVFNKIDNADDALKQQLGTYFSGYGVGDPALQRSQIASALLVGPESAKALEQKLQKSQLRAAATTAGVSISEEGATDLQKQLEASKVYDVYGTAKKAFGEVSQLQPTATKLSEIYGMDKTGLQQELEQEAFFGLASQRRKKLEEKEKSTFSGQSGTSNVSLAQTSTAGQL